MQHLPQLLLLSTLASQHCVLLWALLPWSTAQALATPLPPLQGHTGLGRGGERGVRALSAARGIPGAMQALTIPCSGPGKAAAGGAGPQLPVFGGLAPTYTLLCFTLGAQEKMSCCQCNSIP